MDRAKLGPGGGDGIKLDRMSLVASPPPWPLRGLSAPFQVAVVVAVAGADRAALERALVDYIAAQLQALEVSDQVRDVARLLAHAVFARDVQALKAGVMEIADVFVVNKADRDGADRTVAEVESLLGLHRYAEEEWRPTIVRTEATAGRGIAPDDPWEEARPI